MQHQRAWATLRPLVVDGAPEQAATMLSALLHATDSAPGDDAHLDDEVELLVEIAFAQMVAHDFETAVTTSTRARALSTQPGCRRPGLPALAAGVLVLAQMSLGPADAGEAQVIEEGLERTAELVGGLTDDDPHAPMATYFLAEASLCWGRYPAAEALARAALTAATGPDADRPVDPIAVLLSMQVLARTLLRRGLLVEAAETAEHLRRLAADGSFVSLEALGHGLVAFVSALAGDRQASRDAGQRAIELASPSERSLLDTGTVARVAQARALQQRYAEAGALLLKAAGGPELPRLRWTDRAMAYELLATAAAQQGRSEQGERWIAHLHRMGDAPLVVAAADRAEIAMAATRGDEEDGAAAAGRARRQAQRDGATIDALRTRVLHASALAQAGHRKSALDELEDAARLSGEVGALAMRAQAVREMRRLGRRYRGDTGWSALSPREQHVAELAGQGMTNRQIADRLFMSERTVQSHLETVFRALGIKSRTMLPLVINGLTASTVEEPPAPLTPRQAEVVALVAAGWTNARIAEALEMSVKTVEKHVRDVFVRWGVTTRTAVAALWRAHQPTADGDSGETETA